MKVLILEPYNTASHARWANEWKERSIHDISIVSLTDQHWKWRMHGASIVLAEKVCEIEPDVLVCTAMMDVAALRGLLHLKRMNVPVISYFHESQTGYPISSRDSDKEANRDHHYTFINFTSALASDEVAFNSEFHKKEFLRVMSQLLKRMPDNKIQGRLDDIERKSCVLYPPLSDELFTLQRKRDTHKPVILWNHRWEYDKNPQDFFGVMSRIKQAGIEFSLIVCGESFERCPEIFPEAHLELKEHIIHWGYAENKEEYFNLLRQSDILPVTSHQEFFGYSVTEAIVCGVFPLLPNRLVYPEHISDSQVFYEQSADDLFAKLVEVITTKSFQTDRLSGEMEKYRWSKWITVYDDLISKYEE